MRSPGELIVAFSTIASDVPTPVVHGDDDQVVPIDAAGRKSAKLISDATLKVYEGGSHGIALVPGDKEKCDQDLLDFLKS